MRPQSVALTGGEMGPKLTSRRKSYLKLVRFDFTGDLVSTMEEHERAVLTSNTKQVGMVLIKLGDSDLASHRAVNAERLEE